MPSIHPTELLLILVVALLVIGPERLPATIRTVSLWMGRFRRSFYKVKAEIEREINADEIRRQLHNESVLADIRETQSDVQKVASEARSSVNKIVNSKDFDPGASAATKEQLRNAAQEREAAVTGAGAEQKEPVSAQPAAATAESAETATTAETTETAEIASGGEAQPKSEAVAAAPASETAR